MEIKALRYDTARPVSLKISDGRVVRTTELESHQGRLPWIAPGLVDVQHNGWGGQEFSDIELTVEKVVKIIRDQDAFGVTTICPTVTTNSFETIEHAVRTIAQAEELPEMKRRIAGIHVEGPYFSKEDGPRGAHPIEHCREPDWDEFQRWQEAAGGRICIFTMSAEYQGTPAFIEKASASGVIVALAHQTATSDQIRAAVDAGARLSTHLGNGAHRTLRRHPNYLWDQLAEDRLVASLIVDGHHLPGEVVKTFVRAKTPQRCILVSDVSGLGGLPPGRYEKALSALEILPDGRLVIAGQDQLLAGASRPLGVGVAGVMRFAGVDLPEAITMASTRPANFVGFQPGGLMPGDPADLVIFDLASPTECDQAEQFQVRATVRAGEILYGEIDG